VELLAEGRMAEVYAYGEHRVVKLDRPEWSGVSQFESDVLIGLAAAGLPVARSHGTVTIDGRCGLVLDRVEGTSLFVALLDGTVEAARVAAERFSALQLAINATVVDGLPDLVERLGVELTQSALDAALRDDLAARLTALDDGSRGVCHFDFHPNNVLVDGVVWVVIDWLTVASGPPVADLARTLVIWGQWVDSPVVEFMTAVRRASLAALGIDDATCDDWIAVLAGARLAEGFDGDYAGWLTSVARGEVTLFA
jgi:Ser/Thr protein kinase RdoA (MazF antagonist)